MADEQKKEEQVTAPPATLVDLERRQAEDYTPDAAVRDVVVNPNPFGHEEYAGTDPIYQNHANETEVPLAAEEGPEKDLEDKVHELYSLEDVDEAQVVEDYGQGGKARVSDPRGAQPTRWVRKPVGEAEVLVPADEDGDKAEDDSAEAPTPEETFEKESVSVPVNPSAPNQEGTDASSNQ